MIRAFRAARRAVALGAVMAVYSPLYFGGRLFVRGRPERRSAWRARVFSSWSATLLRVLGARIEVSGKPPRAPFYLVSNHLGYLDILVLASRLEAVFVAKSEVARWPVLGPICRSMDTIFIDRSTRRDISRVLEQTREALGRGDGVVVFPEGTSTKGDEVRPFLPSLLATPVALGQPVHYAALSYATPDGEPAADDAVCWWGGMTFPDHFWALLGISKIDVRLVFGRQAIVDEDRKRLARELREAVLADFTPVVGSEPE